MKGSVHDEIRQELGNLVDELRPGHSRLSLWTVPTQEHSTVADFYLGDQDLNKSSVEIYPRMWNSAFAHIGVGDYGYGRYIIVQELGFGRKKREIEHNAAFDAPGTDLRALVLATALAKDRQLMLTHFMEGIEYFGTVVWSSDNIASDVRDITRIVGPNVNAYLELLSSAYRSPNFHRA